MKLKLNKKQKNVNNNQMQVNKSKFMKKYKTNHYLLIFIIKIHKLRN